MSMRRLLVATLVSLFPAIASAGGYHIDIKVEGVEFKGDNEFKITFYQVGGHPLFDTGQPVVFHLSHAASSQASEAGYVHAINYLLTKFREGKTFAAGVTFNPTPIPGTSNEFQVDGLIGAPDHLHFMKERTPEN